MSDFVFWGNRPWRAISNWMSIICIHLLNIKTCFNLFESPVFQNGYQSFCSATNVSQLTMLFNVIIIIILMFSANSEWLAELRKEEDERIAEWSKNYRDRVIKVLYKTIICVGEELTLAICNLGKIVIQCKVCHFMYFCTCSNDMWLPNCQNKIHHF